MKTPRIFLNIKWKKEYFLKVGCCLVLPVGGSKSQKLKIVTKTKKGFDEQECENVSFVPMLGGTSK